MDFNKTNFEMNFKMNFGAEFPDGSEVDFAIKLHSHLSPGVALGLRMAKLAYSRLGTKKRGKGITGIAETARCLPDALQVIAGTTPGNKNLVIRDYGKLALSVILYEEKIGYRVSLKKEAAESNENLRKFMYKLGKVSKDEEEELASFLLTLDEKYFDIKKIRLTIPLADRKAGIVECSKCHELQPENYTVERGDERLCLLCAGEGYFEEIP